MHFSYPVLLLSTVGVACSVYDANLLAEAVGNGEVGGDGGDATGGMTGEGDGDNGPSGGMGGDTGIGGDIGGGMGATGGDAGSGGTGSGSGSGGSLNGGTESILDDFSDENAVIKLIDDRYGIWSAYTDGTAPSSAMTPGPDQPFVTAEREAGNPALRVSATGFSLWGVGLYAPFSDNGNGTFDTYDLLSRGYDAVRFLAKKETSGDATILNVQIADSSSTLVSDGGTCPDAMATCAYDHARAEVTLTTSWQEYTLPFSGFARVSTPMAVDFSEALQFHLTQGTTDIDFWVDDLRFVDLDD